MYVTEYCSDCHRAKAFFEANKIEYLQVNIEGNEEATNFIVKVNNGCRSVPTIVFPDGTVLTEPSWEELQAKIFGT
jgi:mycoredoxin